MKDCVFCKIISKEIPSDIVFENSKVIAFLDIAPASKGHTLVLPKVHSENISEMSDEDSKELILVIKKISKALLKLFPGLNVVQNNNKVAGQLVSHVHFHLIPRNDKDGIIIDKWSPKKYDNNDSKLILEQIKKLI